MELLRVRTLRGANRWAPVPVLEAEIDFGTRRAPDPSTLAGLVIEYQRQVGSDVSFASTSALPGENRHCVVFQYYEEPIGHAALRLALDVTQARLAGDSFDVGAHLAQLRDLAHDVCLGPSTMAIVRAAQERDIPMRRLGTGSLVVLGHSAKQRRVCTAETDATGVLAENIAQDKDLTRLMLRSVGVPVPEGRPISSAEDAWKAAQELGLPVVVKPQFGNHGRGVATNLTTREQVERAYATAYEESSRLMAEQHIQGDDYRLLVINGKLVAAALREPANVIGDGKSSIRKLVEEVNKDPRRSDGHATSLSWIKLDAVGLGVLDEQGYNPDSIPPAGQRVLIRRNGNLSTGGTATDVTDRVHPEIVEAAIAAARVIGLDIAGVDLVALDVSRSLAEQRPAVVEVNAGPGLRMHLEPSAGKPRPVGKHILDMLFAPGENGRIPLLALGGPNATTTARLLANLLKGASHVVARTAADGMYVNDRRLDTHDGRGPRAARAVLLNPAITAAVLETSNEGILAEGLGFDRCDVAVVSNVAPSDHGVLERVLIQAVSSTGTAVLNADQPLVEQLAGSCKGNLVFFTRTPQSKTSLARRAEGHRIVFDRDGWILVAHKTEETRIISLDSVAKLPLEDVLATVGAAIALKLSTETIRANLAST